MLNSPFDEREEDVEAIITRGPRGAIALAGLTTFIVVAIWFAFYVVVFMPRSPVQ
jgi:hypothetical protein